MHEYDAISASQKHRNILGSWLGYLIGKKVTWFQSLVKSVNSL